jgi:DNA polymerase elongation subunit (family B)
VIAAEQLMKEGVDVTAGKNIGFLFTSAENKRYERRVKAEELIEESTSSDTKKYLHLLYEVAANLLSNLGYSAKTVQDSIRGHKDIELTL